MSADVALVTCAALPDLDPDDRPLAAALAARGLEVAIARWDDPGFDWTAVRLALLRSPWDYYLRPEEFFAWAARTAAATALWNPWPLLAAGDGQVFFSVMGGALLTCPESGCGNNGWKASRR